MTDAEAYAFYADPDNRQPADGDEGRRREDPGPMEAAVLADLKLLNPKVMDRKSTEVQSALVLARQIDGYSVHQGGAAAELSAIANAVRGLNNVMASLRGVGDDDGGGKGLPGPTWESPTVPTAVRDETES